jgi:glycosyltransferase involved in cell wall biosynthesis
MTAARRVGEVSKEAPRRVSLILHTFSRGGSDRVAAYLARGFADLGMDVELVVFCEGGEVERILVDLVGDDIPIVYLGSGRGPRPLDLIRGLPKLAAHLRSRRPDTIISTANNTAWITAAARTLTGLRDAKLILKTTNPIASSRHRGLVKVIRRWGYRRVFRDTAAVWTLSAHESAEMREAFPDFADIFEAVINPYVTPDMLATPMPAGRIARHCTILGVGRLTAQKRFDRLIAAFPYVKTPDVRLIILGEGEDRASLEAQIDRLGIADRVTLPGYVANVADALREASLMVLPSDYEGLPAVVLEAMAANCPVICTDCFPGARALIADAPGCAIIEDIDPGALGALIDRQLSQPQPANIRQAAERYSISNGVASHVALLP